MTLCLDLFVGTRPKLVTRMTRRGQCYCFFLCKWHLRLFCIHPTHCSSCGCTMRPNNQPVAVAIVIERSCCIGHSLCFVGGCVTWNGWSPGQICGAEGKGRSGRSRTGFSTPIATHSDSVIAGLRETCLTYCMFARSRQPRTRNTFMTCYNDMSHVWASHWRNDCTW